MIPLAAPLPLAANNGGGAATVTRRRHPRLLGERQQMPVSARTVATENARSVSVSICWRSPGMRRRGKQARRHAPQWGLATPGRLTESWVPSATAGVAPGPHSNCFQHCAVKRAFRTSYTYPGVNLPQLSRLCASVRSRDFFSTDQVAEEIRHEDFPKYDRPYGHCGYFDDEDRRRRWRPGRYRLDRRPQPTDMEPRGTLSVRAAFVAAPH